MSYLWLLTHLLGCPLKSLDTGTEVRGADTEPAPVDSGSGTDDSSPDSAAVDSGRGDSLGGDTEGADSAWDTYDTGGTSNEDVYAFADSRAILVNTKGTEYFGRTYAADDFDGDGHTDFAVGAHYGVGTLWSDGGAYIFLGPVSGTVTTADAVGILYGQRAEGSGFAGIEVETSSAEALLVAGDTDTNSLYFVDHGGVAVTSSLADAASTVLTHPTTSESFGYRGEFVGDLFGAGTESFAAASTAGEGVLHVFEEVGGSSMSTDDASWLIQTDVGSVGYDVNPAGDINGDGQADLLVGVGTDFSVGYAGLFLGPAPTGVTEFLDADAVFFGTADGTAVGMGMVMRGEADVDGDGYEDVLVGAGTSEVSVGVGGDPADPTFGYPGVVGIFTSIASGAYYSVRDADVSVTGTLGGEEFTGCDVAVEDLNDDGHADLWVGAVKMTVGANTKAGGAWLFHGPVSGALDATVDADRRYVGGAASEYAGWEVSIIDGSLLVASAYGEERVYIAAYE